MTDTSPTKLSDFPDFARVVNEYLAARDEYAVADALHARYREALIKMRTIGGVVSDGTYTFHEGGTIRITRQSFDASFAFDTARFRKQAPHLYERARAAATPTRELRITSTAPKPTIPNETPSGTPVDRMNRFAEITAQRKAADKRREYARDRVLAAIDRLTDPEHPDAPRVTYDASASFAEGVRVVVRERRTVTEAVVRGLPDGDAIVEHYTVRKPAREQLNVYPNAKPELDDEYGL